VPQPNPLTDAQTIAAVRGGDPSAYGELVARYQDRLFRTLSRLLGSVDDAEDVAQEAIIQAYVKLDTFKGNSAFYTWLYRIAFNLAMSHARKRRPATLLDGDENRSLAEPVDQGKSPQQAVETKERIETVQNAINQLADDYRQVVVLRELEGCDYEQIAHILEIPIGTVRSRLFRARTQLKATLTSLVD